MRGKIDAYDWAGTSVGAMEGWPQSLRSTVSLMLASKFPIYIVWGPDRCSLYNDAFIPILGDKHPNALGMPISQLWSEIWDQIKPLVDAAFDDETSYFEDLPILMQRNGGLEQTYFTFSYSGIEGDSGRIEGMFCVCIETTEAYNGRLQRRSENERLQQMFQQAPGFMAVLRGPTHVFEMVNEAYQTLIGPRQLVGKTVAEAVPEAATQGFLALLDQVYTTGTPHIGQAVQLDLSRTPGARLEASYVDFVYQPMFDDARQPVGVFVQGHDVTDQYLAQQALLEADRQKDQFIATLAHELRNPLAPIRTASRILESPGMSPAMIARTTPIISRQVDHMARLLDELLDTARITKGQIALQKEYVSLEAITGVAIEAAHPLVEARGHKLTVTHHDGPIQLEADPIRLTQILSNLLTNAAKYTDAGGSIAIDTRLAGGACEISIRDSGIGLTQPALTRIFTIFAQESTALERSGGGLGIGLALAQGLVQLHGGTLEASSPGPGKGSTFTIRLPHASPAASPSVGTGDTSEPSGMPGKKILIADDNVDLVTTLASFLEIYGHLVVTAHDGLAALKLAGEERPDIAILDIGMPGMNGYDLARAIRREAWGRSMFLIAATGWGHDDDKFKAKAAGFDLHLTKPFAMDKLEEILRAA